MLNKLKQLFLGKKSSEHNEDEPKYADHTSHAPTEDYAKSAEALKHIGDEYLKQRNLPQAERYFKQSLELDPTQFETYKNCGVVHYYQGRLEEAIKCYDKAIAIKPDYPEAYSNRGLALNDLNQLEEALNNLDRAIALKKDFAFAYNNRGMVLKSLNRFEDALLSYDRAVEIKPDFALAYNNKGTALRSLNRAKEALVSFNKAIELNPNYAEAYFNLGETLNALGRPAEAMTGYEYALKFNPGLELCYGSLFEMKVKLCDWSDYENSLDCLEERINKNMNVVLPLTTLAISKSPTVQKRAAEIFTQKRFPSNNELSNYKYAQHNKIRLAYFSGDFFNHAVAFLTAELFEQHDKSKFELTAFSLKVNNDDMKRRIESAFDRFIDASKLSAKEITLMAREKEIDIAIDLGGYTANALPGIFALRAAPIQINYIGFPGTMGADYMDYIIADTTIVPSTHQQYYTEKIVYLPSFQVNDTKRTISDRRFTREELDLPPTGFVFCCFNNITKLTPLTFDSWMRILKQVKDSVLWLVDDNANAINNLKKEAVLRGVGGERLVFAKKIAPNDYLARYRMADLFLDTLPFNAGTTASDALWAGLPVLTQMGETFAGRMAASLLNAIHLPELITHTSHEYEALAVELATNPEKLARIRKKLADNRLTTPLFDIESFTRNIESAYTQMYERHHAGLPPDHIYTDKR